MYERVSVFLAMIRVRSASYFSAAGVPLARSSDVTDVSETTSLYLCEKVPARRRQQTSPRCKVRRDLGVQLGVLARGRHVIRGDLTRTRLELGLGHKEARRAAGTADGAR